MKNNINRLFKNSYDNIMQQQHYPQSSYNNVNNTNNTRVKKIYMSENNINENSVLFSESVKNKIIQDSLFTRIIYSNELFSTNAILALI